MNWNDLTQLLLAEKWLPLAIFVVGYLVRITGDDSKFPINIPHQWQPVVALFIAQVYGVLVAWPNWHPAVQPALIVALGVLAAKAYFHGNEPAWFTWLARVMTPAEKVTKQVDGMPVEVSAVAIATDARTAETLTPPPDPAAEEVVIVETDKKDLP